VVKIATSPGKACHKMALAAIGGKVTFHMVWICCCLVFVFMAVKAFNAKGFKKEQGSRGMTIVAISRDMRPNQGKTAHLVYFRNILHDPGPGRVTFSAIKSKGLVVDIGVTICAFFLRLFKDKGFMATFTIEELMLADQGKIGRIMVKC
jgi:hypothetical protein